ncbi:hypothetical protein ASPCAL08107 [Aspergillus calidoustus]|uniref:Chromosome transmission fidelity protein 4 n=1 Tax=Aspergillus calidoustus TaxID=454130 RepID=A0A0U5CPZ9_ASPCI|nr:hypothetical protein ASPCAL08107 [Aspergillus calidoustus]
MPKLAIPLSSTTTSTPSCVIHIRHLLPRSRTRAASSQARPLAHAQTRHDLPVYRSASASSSPSTLPSHSLPPLFNLNYSLTDDLNPDKDHKPPDERIIKLGKTLRILSPLLPTILTNPLPPHILSPSVTLHLFPSTHPHLPTVKGRTLYRAALWAVPVAWSSVPFVGNVKLQILSERIVRAGTVLDGHLHGAAQDATANGDCGGDERLVVRWRTERTTHSSTSSSSSSTATTSTSPSAASTSESTSPLKDSKHGTNKGLSVLLGGDAPIFKLSSDDQFTGLFIFSFDEEGRVLTQTIEHAEDASGWERTAKFVTLTDWLIGKARGSLEPSPPPGLVGCSSSSGNGDSARSQGPGLGLTGDCWRGVPSEMRG